MWLSMTVQKLFTGVSDVSVLLSSFLAEIAQGTELREEICNSAFSYQVAVDFSLSAVETKQLPDDKTDKEELKGQNQK